MGNIIKVDYENTEQPTPTLTYVDKTAVPSDTATYVDFNFSDVPNYQDLTINNFAIINIAVWSTGRYYATFEVNNYNSSTGVLRIARTSGSITFNSGTQKVRCYYVEQ